MIKNSLFIWLTFALPSLSMDIPPQEDLLEEIILIPTATGSEESPLLKEENKLITPPKTPTIQDIPDEIFWYIMSLCKQNGSFEEQINLCQRVINDLMKKIPMSEVPSPETLLLKNALTNLSKLSKEDITGEDFDIFMESLANELSHELGQEKLIELGNPHEIFKSPRNKWHDVVQYSLINKDYRDKIRKLIPPLIPPRKFYFTTTIIHYLEDLCQHNITYKKAHNKFNHMGINLPFFLDDFPNYRKELSRISELEPWIRYSFYFWCHDGSKKIQFLRNVYDLPQPSPSWWTLPLRPLYSSTRDPYHITFCFSALSVLSLIATNSMMTSMQTYHENQQQAKATYWGKYQENLEYAESSSYPLPNALADYYNPSFIPQNCFTGIQSINACLSWNNLCSARNKLDYLNNLTVSPGFQENENFMKSLYREFNGTFSLPKLQDFILNSLEQLCASNNFIRCYIPCDNCEIPCYFSKRHSANNILFKHLSYQAYFGSHCLNNNQFGHDELYLGYHSYDPQCVATYLTPPIQMPEFPSSYNQWIYVMGSSWSIFLVTLLMGWVFSV